MQIYAEGIISKVRNDLSKDEEKVRENKELVERWRL